MAALLLELPQREIGGRLPPWDDLVAQTGWARERGIAAAPRRRPAVGGGAVLRAHHAEIAGLFDSVYVSFYKDLGALAGAALAGDAELVAEARVWQRRHGGNLVTMHPFVVSAELSLDQRLERIPAFVEHARALAASLSLVEGIEVVPDPPQTPMFHVLLRGDRERLSDAALRLAEERKVFLFADPFPTTSPSVQRHEVTVGENTLLLDPAEVAELYAQVLAWATCAHRRLYAAQENGAEWAFLPSPSRSMPNALMLEEVGMADGEGGVGQDGISRSPGSGWVAPSGTKSSVSSSTNLADLHMVVVSRSRTTRTARASMPSISPISGAKALHRPTHLPAEHPSQQLRLLLRGVRGVHQHAHPPVAVDHLFRGCPRRAPPDRVRPRPLPPPRPDRCETPATPCSDRWLPAARTRWRRRGTSRCSCSSRRTSPQGATP